MIRTETREAELRFIHTLSMTKVRKMCIDNDYYTAGDCRAYSNMFDMFYEKDVTPELVREIAVDIKNHSITEDEIRDIVNNISRLIYVSTVLDRIE